MNENPNRTAKAIKVVFAVFMLFYGIILCLVFFVDWNTIYVFSDSPEVILVRKRKANALKEIVQLKKEYQSSFSKIKKADWLTYKPEAYNDLDKFAKKINSHVAPEELLPFKSELRMNSLLISHYTGLVNGEVLAEKKRVLEIKLAAERKLKLAQEMKKASKARKALEYQALVKKRDRFVLLVSQQKVKKDTWHKVAKNEYVELNRLVTELQKLKGEALQDKSFDLDAGFITLNYYTGLVESELKADRIKRNGSNQAKGIGKSVLADVSVSSKKITVEDPKLLVKKQLARIDQEYERFSKVKLYDRSVFLKCYSQLSKYIIEALRSNLSASEVTKILDLKKAIEAKRDQATKVVEALKYLKPVKIDEKKLDGDYLAKVNASGYPVEVRNNLGIHFRFIPAGTFLMGSPKSEKGRDKDELQHKVKLTNPFYMQVSEMSVKQFRFQKDADVNSPALVKVTKQMALDFCDKLNLRDVLFDGKYDLPTEAQWEYACRATTVGPHYTNNLKAIAFYDHNYSGKVGKRGQLKPNIWGLYDMLGNAKEICRDQASSSFFFTKPPKTYQDPGTIPDPIGSDGSEMVLRGGGWTSSESEVRAAARELSDAEYKLWDTGFRIIYKLD